jgi:acetyltransferase
LYVDLLESISEGTEKSMAGMKPFFDPESVALAGASDKAGSVGRVVLENLLLAKDTRRIYPINPNRETILDTKCYANLCSLPETPSLLVVATNAKFVVDIIEEAAKISVKNIIIISSGFRETGEEGRKREAQVSRIAKKNGIRIIGPNCLGVIRPGVNLNATFAQKVTKKGSIAFLSQSGALGSAVLDWAATRDIGFSTFVSLGIMLDVDFGDLIDYLGEDPATRSIIIYLESLGNSLVNARKFMSAARGFARTKPIIVIKPGKFQESARAAQSHTGAMAGEDLYYEAAFDRAGTVRVEEIEDLFNCASILDSARLPRQRNLAIITNAGGPAVLATDALVSRGGKLAELNEKTIAALNEHLPPYWSKGNPIDILGDANEELYEKAISAALKDPGVSGAVIIYTPQGAAEPAKLAETIVKQAETSSKPILTVMMGSREVAKARQIFYDHNVPTYEFPEDAIKTYLYMYQYQRHLEELYEAPEDLPLNDSPPRNHLKILMQKAIKEGKSLLGEEDSKELLTTYGIPVTIPLFVRSPEEAAITAESIGFPVVMKISSPDISHKSDLGGVILSLRSAVEVKNAFDQMTTSIRKHKPEARIEGVTIQKMVTDYDYELIVGSKKDPILGPVILFGRGGTETEFFKDISIGLPPLNQKLAQRAMERTHIYSLLSQGFRAKPPANLRVLEEILIKVSNIITDFPEIKELDINPLAVSGGSAVALDARVVLDLKAPTQGVEDYSHLIISPYPTKYIQPWKCYDGRDVILRPIRPEDEPLERELITGLSPESSRFRFFHIIRDISHDMLSRFCNIDYAREMAIIAEFTAGGTRRNVGVGRLIMDSGDSGEFAVVVADDFQNNGLGLKLCDILIGIGAEKGLKSIFGIVLNDNKKMIGLSRKLGFTMERISEDESRINLEM